MKDIIGLVVVVGLWLASIALPIWITVLVVRALLKYLGS